MNQIDLAGRRAAVTGAAQGIGRATAERLIAEGACVVVADIVPEALDEVVADLAGRYSADLVHSLVCDVTDEAAVQSALAETCRAFGGIDIVVCNAGIVTGGPFDETTLAQWRANIDVLSTGYFLVAREGYRAMKAQGLGGSIIFVASKNALAASVNAAAYCAAKASELHLARCMAVEGAPHGIRVNVVNPDGVLRGSRMWSDERRKERAEAYRVEPEELDAYYRDRTLLKQSVYPEDIAEGIVFFAGDTTRKSTGNVLNIDGGNAQSFPR